MRPWAWALCLGRLSSFFPLLSLVLHRFISHAFPSRLAALYKSIVLFTTPIAIKMLECSHFSIPRRTARHFRAACTGLLSLERRASGNQAPDKTDTPPHDRHTDSSSPVGSSRNPTPRTACPRREPYTAPTFPEQPSHNPAACNACLPHAPCTDS